MAAGPDERPRAAQRPSDSLTACLQGTATNSETNSIYRLKVGQATTGAACGEIRTSGFRRLAGCEAVLEARARADSSSHSFYMVFSVNLSLRPILSLISLSLLAAVLVLDLWYM